MRSTALIEETHGFRYQFDRRQTSGTLNYPAQIFGRGALCQLIKIDFLRCDHRSGSDLGIFGGCVAPSCYAARLRRIAPIPAKPRAKSARVAGSGADATGVSKNA